MTLWLSAGVIFTLASVLLILVRWGGTTCTGSNPTSTFTFIAILFTSGLDVGLIMFPLTEFGNYADLTTHPEYAFANPLAIEFGYWGFLIWSFYFLTCFYFCILEPKLRFFEIPWVKAINNLIIIGTCAFTAYLLLSNLPWYLPGLVAPDGVVPVYHLIVFAAICAAVYSSTDLRFVKALSISTTWLFFALIALLLIGAAPGVDWSLSASLLGEYFTNMHQFVLPLNDYHAFYLYWWFAWSIMIGQFTARFIGGLSTVQVFAAMLIFPSIPIALWFSVLYHYHLNSLQTAGMINLSMVTVGIVFVVNSLDSLVRLYTDNLGLTVERLGKRRYLLFNVAGLCALTLLFQLDFLEIEWVGAVVIGLYLACFAHLLYRRSS